MQIAGRRLSEFFILKKVAFVENANRKIQHTYLG